jgi:hypothetical protein
MSANSAADAHEASASIVAVMAHRVVFGLIITALLVGKIGWTKIIHVERVINEIDPRKAGFISGNKES